MARVSLPIAQGFYVDESLPISAQRCVNLYPHIPQTKTITQASLIGTAGLSTAWHSLVGDLGATLADTPIRGIALNQGIYPVFVGSNDNVVGQVTYTEDTFGNRTYSVSKSIMGTPVGGTGAVIMATNGPQTAVVSNEATKFNAYMIIGGAAYRISDADFDGPASYVCFMDGYFVFLKSGSGKFFVSNLNDGLSYTATDFATAESDPDNSVACAPLNGLLYIFGSVTCEQWRNEGGGGFPFVKATSGTLQKGCLAPRSLTEFNGALIWIGGGVNEQAGIWATSGGQPEKISTPAIDFLINSGGVTKLAQAFTMKWSSKGHSFISFTVPDICCVQYDSTTGLWSTRESKDISGNVIPWRASGLLYAYSVNLVIDSIDARLGVMSDTVYTEYDTNISSYFVTPAFDNDGNPFTINSLELMMENGTQDITQTPSVRLAVSDNGGRTFYPDISRFMGYAGDYTRRISWDLLGRYSRSVCFKVSIDEPIKKVFVKGEIVVAN